MNIILIGFSTTGKSTILKKHLKGRVNSGIDLIDSDKEISREFDCHIFNLYLEKFDSSDPVNRGKILAEIANKENEFLGSLMDNKSPYIAAMGPNIHIRDNWKNYYASHKPMTIFLKSKPELVLKGLVRREEELREYQSKKGFASWNQGVTREYNDQTQSYESLPEFLALNKIKELIKMNEDAYERIADYTFDSTELFEWHDNYNENTKEYLINLICENAG